MTLSSVGHGSPRAPSSNYPQRGRYGTAFDIAGQGIAQPSSLLEAIDYALKLGSAK